MSISPRNFILALGAVLLAGAPAMAQPQPPDPQHVANSAAMAELILSVLPAAGAPRPDLAGLRRQARGVTWAARPTSRNALANGRLGRLDVVVEGRGQQPQTLSIAWRQAGAEIPHDVVTALRQRGVTLAEMACEYLGAGEGERRYAGSAPGRAPFTLALAIRHAPTAGATAYYVPILHLDGRHPQPGNRENCDF